VKVLRFFRKHIENALNLLLLLLFILTANEFLPDGSGTAIRHNTHITHITENSTAHKSTQ
jgi:hypothetical protein